MTIRENRARAVLLSRASMVRVRYFVLIRPLLPPFKLLAEHFRVKLTDMVEVISLRRDLDTLYKILPVHAAAHKGAASR